MYSDGESFLKRALIFQREVKLKKFPNATSLAKLAGCSKSTARRVIERLRYEYCVPIEYDESRKGYYLTNPNYEFNALPPGKDELTALLCLSKL